MMSVNIANGLDKQNVKSYLCATRKEGALKLKLNDTVKYIFLNKKSAFDIFAILRLKRFINANEINIIHAHSSSYFIASIVKVLIPKVKLIWHDHYGNSEHLPERKKQPLKYFSKYFKGIISVNNLLKIWAIENLKTSKVYYLSNFATLSDSKKEIVLKGIDGKRIVCLAGLRPQKDHRTLLKAFEKIMVNNNEWTLHLVGNHYNDKYYQTIKSFIIEKELSNRVHLYHNVIDVKNILSQTTIAVLSSVSEGLPVSLLEYGLAKLSVVVTNVGECRDVLGNGKYGLLVEPSNERELALNIETLINDKELRIKFSLEFNKHVIENYSEDKIIYKLLKIYDN